MTAGSTSLGNPVPGATTSATPPRNLGGAGLLLVSEILIIFGCFYFAALIDLEADPWIYFAYEGGIERLLFAVATLLQALDETHRRAYERPFGTKLIFQEALKVEM